MYAALTVRKLKPGTYDQWREAWWPQDTMDDSWPEGAGNAYILRNLNNPDEIIAFGFFEGDVDALRNDAGFQDLQRKRMEAMAPFIDSVGADGIYEVVEEIIPG